MHIALFLTLIWILYKVLSTGRRASKLPPGPPVLPVLGNLHLLPNTFLFLKLTEWAKEYGEIFSLKVANQTIIVLNTPEAVREVLEKRQATTADRPPNHIIATASENLNVAFMSSKNPLWAKQRKAIRGVLTQKAVDDRLPVQVSEIALLMHDILKMPEVAAGLQDLYNHLTRSTVSGQLRLNYGTRNANYEGSEAQELIQVVELFNQATDPSTHPPVDLFPMLKYVPERWASWKRLCRKSESSRRKLYVDRLLNPMEERLKKGIELGAFMEAFSQDLPVLESQDMNSGEPNYPGNDSDMYLHRNRHMGAAMMEAAFESTATFLKNFIAAMISYPEYQLKAHEEMDRVVGNERLPELKDIPSLKYMNAIIEELVRMRPPFPTGVPHLASADEIYKDYVIPKGSVIFMNIWGIGRDSSKFIEPETFNPDRFLSNEHGTKPGETQYYHRPNIAFGAGRRICPGENLSRRTMALNVMHLLWGFEFQANSMSSIPGTKAFDMENYSRPGIAAVPKPLGCDVKARGHNRVEMMRAAYEREWGVVECT